MRTEYWCEYYWAGTFRENHNMWFGIQDTTISYLIARNPWLKKQNSFQSTKELVESNWPVLYCCINSTTWNLESRGSSLSLSLSLSSTLSYHLYHLSLGEESAQLGHVIVIVFFVFVIFLSLSLSLSLSYHLNHLVLGEESSQLGHVCWAEFAFKLVQRWPVLLARLTIMIIAQIQMLWLYEMGHVSCEK